MQLGIQYVGTKQNLLSKIKMHRLLPKWPERIMCKYI